MSSTIIGWFDARNICKENGGDLLYLNPGGGIEQLQEVLENGFIRDQGTAHIGVQHMKWMWHKKGKFSKACSEFICMLNVYTNVMTHQLVATTIRRRKKI